MAILVVDDHVLFAEGLSRVLREGLPEHEVHFAHSVDEALAAIESGPDFALVLLDLGLPGGDGKWFIEGVYQRELDVPVAVLSATDDIERIEAALTAGALGFVPKCHHGAELLEALRTMLQGDLYLPASIRHALATRRAAGGKDAPHRRLGITDAQMRVLECLADGCSNGDIAQRVHVSENTVKSHLQVLFQTLGVSNRTAAVQQAREQGLLG